MAEADASPPDVPAIRLTDVSVRRGSTTILDQISWTLPRGHCAVLLGHNGSGKTTLTRIILGYEWPTSGQVEAFGERYGDTDLRQLRRRISLVNPSDRYGVDHELTARDAVLTGLFGTLALYDPVSDEQRDRADALLQSIGMGHRREQRFGVLSTGEQRRTLLARAMMHMPDLLILDEPTAGLDVNAREHLLATIATLRMQRDALTILMVTHHVEEIGPGTDQVILLRQGRITACGRPADVITPESLSEAFQCKVYVQKRSGRYWLEVLPEAWLDLLR